jgi:tight adherence protein C
MLLPIIVVLFITLALGTFALGAAAVAPASPLGLRLRQLLGQHATPEENESRIHEQVDRVVDKLSRAVPKSPEEVSKTRGLLIQAGYRETRHVAVYFATRALLAIATLVLVFITGWAWRSPVLIIAPPLLAYILPRFVLKRMIKHRQSTLRLSLADALDLTVICMEAGLGLDQALKRVGEELKHAHPELSDEFDLVSLEMRAGKSRAEALRNLAARTGVDDVRALVSVLVQSDRFGTSIAQALRVHSDALRTERRQRAEEAAAKTTIKMVPVLVFFLFPAMFIVSIGPAFIQIVRHLLPVIQQ